MGLDFCRDGMSSPTFDIAVKSITHSLNQSFISFKLLLKHFIKKNFEKRFKLKIEICFEKNFF
jgi:hypothetical protein